MLAAKFIDDAFFNNAYYAKVGGVSTAEINRLEMKFLFSLDFRLQVTIGTFERYCVKLDKETGHYHIERPIQFCGLKENRALSHRAADSVLWFKGKQANY
ncbi:hypothetical protein MKX01_011655 [Papaver californicum]|nr:hypothetical protein MKX01_011655 [Papaver californicum]